MEQKTFEALEKQLLDEHFVEYKTFTRQLLTISGGCLALLGTLGKAAMPEVISAHAAFASQLALVLFLFSTGAGVELQRRLAQRPILDLDVARALLHQRAHTDPENTAPIQLRRKPSPFEKLLYRLQLWTFFLAFAALTAHSIAR